MDKGREGSWRSLSFVVKISAGPLSRRGRIPIHVRQSLLPLAGRLDGWSWWAFNFVCSSLRIHTGHLLPHLHPLLPRLLYTLSMLVLCHHPCPVIHELVDDLPLLPQLAPGLWLHLHQEQLLGIPSLPVPTPSWSCWCSSEYPPPSSHLSQCLFEGGHLKHYLDNKDHQGHSNWWLNHEKANFSKSFFILKIRQFSSPPPGSWMRE